MTRYSIYLNYERGDPPIGFVDLEDNVSEDIIKDGAILPLLGRKTTEEDFKVISFGLVPRTTVDTSPRNETL